MQHAKNEPVLLYYKENFIYYIFEVVTAKKDASGKKQARKYWESEDSIITGYALPIEKQDFYKNFQIID